jgi:hypothetical protein
MLPVRGQVPTDSLFSRSKLVLANIIPVRDLIDPIVRSVTNQSYFQLLTSVPQVQVHRTDQQVKRERNDFGIFTP